MKTKQVTLPVVMDVSLLTCDFTDEAGNGIVGFTATHTDGSFKNFTLTFSPETQAAVQAEILTIKQIMESSVDTFIASTRHNNEHHTKCNYKQRKLS